ncbi:MAG: sulfatase [Bacteroidales bacterium]|nr:sulfatase [Bacteroidales bacterium]
MRTDHNFLMLLAASVGATASALPSRAQQAPTRPNILFILAEDMTLDLGCYGRTDVKTPNIDRLASEGVVYTNARCVAPLSSPTRSSMMTGLHHEITASHNHRSHRDQPLPEDIVPYPVLLRQAGYTAVLGDRDAFENPVTHADHESSRKIDCNFKYEPTGSYDGNTTFGLFDRLYDRPSDGTPWFQQITLYVTHRGDWWKDIRSRSAHPVDPSKVELPPYMADHPRIREEFACYLDQVEYMDAEVGKILEKLRSDGQDEKTVVIFIADNGRADIRAKGWMYNDGTRIPMIVRAPGLNHKVVDDLVSELDIPATILSLAGVDIPKYYQGKVLEAFSGKPSAHEWSYHARDTWDEVQECIRAVTDDRYIYVRNYVPQLPYTANHCYTYCYRPALHVMKRLKEEGKLNPVQLLFFADSKPVEELYDWKADEFCVKNLAGDPAYLNILNTMRNRMDDWQFRNRDAGVEDHLTRVLPGDRAAYRRQQYFAERFRPEEWAEIEDGAICDSYDRWKTEIREMWADNAVRLSDPIVKVPDSRQAAFFCDGHIVTLNIGAHAKAFRLSDGNLDAKFDLACAEFNPHCNVADMTTRKGRNYLYISEWNGERRFFVEDFRHKGNKWTSRLIQTISANRIPDEIKGFGYMDWVPDFDNNKLYSIAYKENHPGHDIVGSTKLIILEFALPNPKKGDVDFTEKDILRRTEIPVFLATQDKHVHNGKLYIVAGLKNKANIRDTARNHLRTIAVFDLESFRLEKEIRLDFYDREPEGIDFIGDDMYLTYNSDALYKVIPQGE